MLRSLFTPTAISGVRFYLRLSVCLSVFSHSISITNVARIIKLEIKMFHDESWTKLIYLG